MKNDFWGKNMLKNGPAGHGAGQWFWAGETAHMACHCSRMQCTLALYTLALYLRSCDVSSQRNQARVPKRLTMRFDPLCIVFIFFGLCESESFFLSSCDSCFSPIGWCLWLWFWIDRDHNCGWRIVGDSDLYNHGAKTYLESTVA